MKKTTKKIVISLAAGYVTLNIIQFRNYYKELSKTFPNITPKVYGEAYGAYLKQCWDDGCNGVPFSHTTTADLERIMRNYIRKNTQK